MGGAATPTCGGGSAEGVTGAAADETGVAAGGAREEGGDTGAAVGRVADGAAGQPGKGMKEAGRAQRSSRRQ